MGYVPARPLSLHGQGFDVPRRQHRRSRPAGNPDLARRADGPVGEAIARTYLKSKGVTILASNVRVGRGEIDLIVDDSRTVCVVEVRLTSNGSYPLDALDETKRRQVRTLALNLGINRCDGLGVGVFDDHVIVHWDPDSF